MAPRAGKGIHPRHAGDPKLPFEAVVIGLEIIVADGPIDDIVALKIDSCAVGESAGNFVAVNFEIPGHEARCLAGPKQHGTAEDIERARAVTEVAGLRRAGAENPRLVAHSLKLIRARDVADGIALRVLRCFQCWSALEGHDFETSRSELLGQDSADSAYANDANISNRSVHDSPGFFGKPCQVTGGRSTTLLI